MTHLLVTNDFPPKVGGIQTYLYELWRRLPPDRFSVFTTNHALSHDFDAAQSFRITRSRHTTLWPVPSVMSELRRVLERERSDLVVLDPALPIGLAGPRLGRRYAVVLHGAEVTVPGRLPATRRLLSGVLRGASLLVAAGGYPAAEAARVVGPGRLPPTVTVPPGVDAGRFVPLDAAARGAGRLRLGLPERGRLIVSVSRLVPRKGVDVLIEAVASLRPEFEDLLLVVGGSGRDLPRLRRLAERTRAPVRFLGRLSDDDVPLLDGCADVWAMVCRDRWLGLEQEGFGIVFLEAAACGVPQVAGRSGGAEEAVLDGSTGIVVADPTDVVAVRQALSRLLADAELRARLGAAARQRAVQDFDYDRLAERLLAALTSVGG